jgi:CRISPR/Cas system-associated protein Csx1
MTNNNNSILPKQFLNYINYELNICEKITHKKFFNILSNDRFELSVCVTNDDEDIDNNIDNKYNKSKYQVIYRANNLHQFIKKLFMIKEHLIKNFGNGITTITL